jgi:hypothetical protein
MSHVKCVQCKLLCVVKAPVRGGLYLLSDLIDSVHGTCEQEIDETGVMQMVE